MFIDNIFLTGFMGVGKSKIGGILASRLGRRFLDTDVMVETKAGMPIRQIFTEFGEDHFRKFEHSCVEEICRSTNFVVALGGGAIVQPCNFNLIRDNGILVCITADVDTILTRIDRRDDRPLLSGLDQKAKRAKIEAMLRDRASYYACAQITIISCEGSKPEKTADELVEQLERWDEARASSD